jgi:hypothetical protein
MPASLQRVMEITGKKLEYHEVCALSPQQCAR